MYKNILFPIDLNQDSSWTKALPTALDYCKAFGSTLHVLNVVPDFGMSIVGSYFPEGFEEKALEGARTQLHEFVRDQVPEGVAVQHIVGHGSVYNEILRVAHEIKADLILLAAHRPELKDFLLGPNAARVVRHFEGSVLVVR
ncbi:MAG: nucleotide-binding universal stress UspA family protein [Alphaproteobacteria bacterium]|jgi:nucleotide-binding universal stress UspA family protein